MNNKSVPPTSTPISPEAIDKAFEKCLLSNGYQHPSLLYLHPYDLRLLKYMCPYGEIVESQGDLMLNFLKLVPTKDVPIGVWYLADRKFT